MTVFEFVRDELGLRWFADLATDIAGLFRTATDTLDARRAEVELARRLRFPVLAEGEALKRHGRARSILKLSGETDADYRVRVLAAYAIWRAAGTVPGVEDAVRLLKFHDVEVQELRAAALCDGAWFCDGWIDCGGLVWALFDLRIDLESDTQIPGLDAWNRLVRPVRFVKPARSRLYRFHFFIPDGGGGWVGWKTIFADGNGRPVLCDGGTYNGVTYVCDGTLGCDARWGLPEELWT